jgi:hypothetical protein
MGFLSKDPRRLPSGQRFLIARSGRARVVSDAASGHVDLDRWIASADGGLSATGVLGDTFSLRPSSGFAVGVADALD